RTRPLRIWRSPPIADRSRPARSRAPIAPRSTISCCASRRSWAARPAMPDEERSRLMDEALPARPTVDAYLGLGSRYSYLASTQLERIAADAGVTFNWIPIVSADLFAARNPFEGPPVSPQYDMRYREADARAWADYYVVPFREPTGRLSFDPALLVRGALAAADARVPMMKRLFQAVFADERTRIDLADVADCAQMVGLDRFHFRKVLADPALEAERLVISEKA